jgi:hypothetical protein
MQRHKTKQNKPLIAGCNLRCHSSGWRRGRKISLSVFERHYAVKLFYLYLEERTRSDNKSGGEDC